MQSIEKALTYEPIFAVLNNLKGDELVVFDVDQVLIDPTDHILSGRAHNYKVELFQDLIDRLGQETFDHLYSIIVRDREVAHVDRTLPEKIQELHKQGIHTMALTAFWHGSYGVIDDMSAFRVKQLKDLGYDFSPNKPHATYEYTMHVSPRLGRHPFLRDGVLHTSHVSKGDVLRAYIETHGLKPSKVIFIDDQPQYLQEVRDACAEMGLPLQAFHLCQATQKAANQEVDKALVDTQFRHLETHKVWLCDEKAKQYLAERNKPKYVML